MPACQTQYYCAWSCGIKLLTPNVFVSTLTSPHTDTMTNNASIPYTMKSLPCLRFSSLSALAMNCTTPQMNTSIATAKRSGTMAREIRQMNRFTSEAKSVMLLLQAPLAAKALNGASDASTVYIFINLCILLKLFYRITQSLRRWQPKR